MCTKMISRATPFGQWLTGVVQRHDLTVDVLGKSRRAKTWSERLASAMDEGPEYDSYLRRVAGGKIVPGALVTYKIGRGLRAAGLKWCSGALALMRNQRTFKELLALIDIASIDNAAHADFVDWFYLSDMTESVEVDTFGPNDEEFSKAAFRLLSDVTDRLAPAMQSAFERYQSRGLRHAHGLLGIAYQVFTDERSGSRAGDAMRGLVALWLDEVPNGSQASDVLRMFERGAREIARRTGPR
jgi:hypothetical protein